MPTEELVRSGLNKMTQRGHRHDDNTYYKVKSTRTGTTRNTDWYGSFTGVPNELSDLGVTYKGKNSLPCTQTLHVWNWLTNRWNQIDSQIVGTTEVQVDASPTGDPADYVSGTTGDGELRLRVLCKTTDGTFVEVADLMSIEYLA